MAKSEETRPSQCPNHGLNLFVIHETLPPDVHRSGGKGLVVKFGFYPSPFGEALILFIDRGLIGLGFADEDSTDGRHAGETGTGAYNHLEALADMKARWPGAIQVEDNEQAKHYGDRIFRPSRWEENQPLPVVLFGTEFQVKVWLGLLDIDVGKLSTYSQLAARLGRPDAARAVGTAVGRNPISFVVPCHRVIGKSGELTGYYWGLNRKRAMLDWEARISAL